MRAQRSKLEIVQDRFRLGNVDRGRVIDAFEAALRVGRGRVNVRVPRPDARCALTPALKRGGEGPETVWRFSTDLHCADCDIHYRDPTPSLFSFNSPLGACETCRGFGRVIGIDFGLVTPDTEQDAARRRDQAVADRVEPRMPGRPAALREEAGHSRRHAVARAHRGAAAVGARRRRALGKESLVRRAPVLPVARNQELQDARARAAREVPQLHAVPHLQWRAAQGRSAAVAARGAASGPGPASTSTN